VYPAGKFTRHGHFFSFVALGLREIRLGMGNGPLPCVALKASENKFECVFISQYLPMKRMSPQAGEPDLISAGARLIVVPPRGQ
jgi:hypothetical protein